MKGGSTLWPAGNLTRTILATKPDAVDRDQQMRWDGPKVGGAPKRKSTEPDLANPPKVSSGDQSLLRQFGGWSKAGPRR